MRRASAWVAGAGAAVLAVSLWLPWFHGYVPFVVRSVTGGRSESGWAALHGLGTLVLVVVLMTAQWIAGRLPAYGLVVGGALVLMVETAVTVDRLDVAGPGLGTATPAPGLLLAFAGASAVVLVGVGTLLGDARRRASAERAV